MSDLVLYGEPVPRGLGRPGFGDATTTTSSVVSTTPSGDYAVTIPSMVTIQVAAFIGLGGFALGWIFHALLTPEIVAPVPRRYR